MGYWLWGFPRKLAAFNHFTFYAELQPHTEQVVFLKASLFGGVRKVMVDISNLEKVDASVVGSDFLFLSNNFCPDMVFRDMATGEFFVFDSYGVW
eukprot:CAMPEP_0202959652 /NCGR_PEP_ID=MMETSP1396-20130829/3827_1 /ASSEMBLY_ACC=CAM_ASM_000872 /TAXON_ID= /ORGANISM="Pseudokeronopsis sp., Strain Brazil" /LENGTH=94 /DNA_ID=CAMNT_0049678329 /DNA_START=556 /DNA_END=837 /DNA_ORIENTATION=-